MFKKRQTKWNFRVNLRMHSSWTNHVDLNGKIVWTIYKYFL